MEREITTKIADAEAQQCLCVWHFQEVYVMHMKKGQKFWLAALVLSLLLTCVACDSPKANDADAVPDIRQEQTAADKESDTAKDGEKETKQEINPDTGKDKYQTDPVPEGKPAPVEPENTAVDNSTSYTCTFSISCATILNNMDECDESKKPLVPADGVILPATTVTFSEGESVFDVLQRVCRENRIHMESSRTTNYNSAYVKGINNLYEFDVGSLSGWMYSVNDWFPNYGCSRYALQNGDVVKWVYTCDSGYDVGGGYSTGS